MSKEKCFLCDKDATDNIGEYLMCEDCYKTITEIEYPVYIDMENGYFYKVLSHVNMMVVVNRPTYSSITLTVGAHSIFEALVDGTRISQDEFATEQVNALKRILQYG